MTNRGAAHACADGGGENPQEPGQKPDPGRQPKVGALRALGGAAGPAERALRKGFRRKVSGGRLLSPGGLHLP